MSLSAKHKKLLNDVYYRDSMLMGRDKLYHYLVSEHPNDHPTRNEVMTWLKSQKVHQLHVRAPPRQPTKAVIVQKPLRYFQLDLTGPFARDRGFKWILGIVDVSTKMLYTAALKNKSSDNVGRALQKIITENDLNISVIQSDGGGEFQGQEMQELYNKYAIRHITSKAASPWTNGCIERVWGTIKQMLYKHQSIHSWENWSSILPKLTENYNKSYHRSIKCSPLEAVNLSPKILLERLRDSSDFLVDEPEETLKVGDTVRLRLIPESKLDKARQYYTNETYTIAKVVKGNGSSKITSYKIRYNKMEILKGTYNYTDLLPIQKIQEPPKNKSKEARIKRIGMQRQAEIDPLERGRNLRPKPVRNNDYIVEKIIDTRIQNHRIAYLVKWSGYESPTWQNEDDLVNAKGKIKEFLRTKNLVYVLV